MIRPFRLLFIIPLFIGACGEPEKPLIPAGRFADAAAYNDFILGLQDSLDLVSGELADGINDGKRKAALEATVRFRSRCKTLADTLKSLQDWKGDSSLRLAAVHLFETYEQAAAKYPAMLAILFTEDAVDTAKVTDTIPENDTTDANAALIPRYEHIQRKISKMQEEALGQFYQAQRDFAEKFKVKLAVGRRTEGEEE
ncbi:MAG: hypothetical protein FD123_3555 [Bacteroidetes bacterium]|nr:MAG: hypothetical protein FD123_3555 [Bacteroidota bacterium]